jgi:hypothetical protein
MKFSGTIILSLALTLSIYSCKTDTGVAVVQTPIARVEQMPDLPQPYKIIDWKQKALQFDSLVFNFTNTTAGGPTVHAATSTR